MMPADMVSRAPDATAKNAADGVNPVRDPCTNARSRSQNTMKIIVLPLSKTRGQDKFSLYQRLKVKHVTSQNNQCRFAKPANLAMLKRRGATGEAFDAE
jgi:hypothetical protein